MPPAVTRRRWWPPLSQALVVGLSALLLSPALVGRSEADGGDQGLIHACVKLQVGTTRIVPPSVSCGPSETAVHWSIVGPQGPPGPTGPPGQTGPPAPEGAGGLQVVDSEDQTVAPVVGLEFLNAVAGFNVDGLAFTLKLVDHKLHGYAVLYFLTANCSGQAYIQRFEGFALPATAVDEHYRVGVDAGSESPVLRPLGSVSTHNGCASAGYSLPVVPATLLLDLRERFTPPFRVR